MISEAEARERLQDLIEQESTLVLSTAGADGPSGAPLFFVPGEGGALYWLSSPSSRHSRELEGQVAVSIHASTFRWEAIRGAQLRGTAAVVEAAEERAALLQVYRRRFGLDESFDPLIARSALYRFTPRWARYLDNGLGFPGRVEIAFGSPA
jgi:uncharacterized protein YhbP (UPF0306 family)